MSIIARTLDNKRLSYDGRVYIEIPENIPSEDAVVIHKKRLPHLRGVNENVLDLTLSREARLVLDTIKAHNTMTESCDRDGNEFCDCLERATARLERALTPTPRTGERDEHDMR